MRKLLVLLLLFIPVIVFAQTGDEGSLISVRTVIEVVLLIVTTVFGERWYRWYGKAKDFSDKYNQKVDEMQDLAKQALKDLEDGSISKEEWEGWIRKFRQIFSRKIS